MMKRKLLTLLAVVALCATAAGPVIATVAPSGGAVAAAAPSAPISPTDETKVPHYFGPYPNWANSPQVLADAIVTISLGTPTPVTVGNPLMARAYDTDGAANVFVVNTNTPLAAGVLTAFHTWAQVPLGTGPYTFNAYVLRPTVPGVRACQRITDMV